jgi:drug/metabolite transporter (DMT)-like permease
MKPSFTPVTVTEPPSVGKKQIIHFYKPNSMNKSSERSFDSPAALSCIGVLICWVASPLFIEYLTDYLDAWTQNLLRYGAASLFWLPFLLADIKAGRLTKKVWKLALLPFIPNVIMQSFWAFAFYYIDPGFVTLLVTTSIIWAVILSMILFKDERQLIKNRRFQISIILCVIGVAGVMLSNPTLAKSYTITGIIIILLYDFVWGFYAVAVKASMRDTDSRIGFSIISLYTVAGLAIPALLFGRPAECLELSLASWAAVIVSGIIGIGLGHVFYYVSIRRLGATISSLVLLSQPFAVIVLSYVLFGESLSVLQWVFGIILAAGSALVILSKKETSLPTI